MAIEKISEESGQIDEYEAPALTRFGSIEEWTLGALDGISISLVL